MATSTTAQKWNKARLYVYYWVAYLLVFTLMEGVTDHDFLAVFRNELVSLLPKVLFVSIVIEYLAEDLFAKRYGQFVGRYVLLLMGFAVVLRLIDNYITLRYFLIHWKAEPLLSSAPLLYNVIKLQFLLAVPLSVKVYAQKEGKEGKEEKAFISLKCERRMVKVFYDDIWYFEAQGNYLITHTVNGPFKSYLSISDLEGRLPEAAFARIHRSFIVSLNKVRSYTSSLVVVGDKEIPIGRSYLAKARISLG